MGEELYEKIYEQTKNDPRCQCLEKKLRELARKIVEELGDNRGLFLEYEKLVYLSESYNIESAYREGVSSQK